MKLGYSNDAPRVRGHIAHEDGANVVYEADDDFYLRALGEPWDRR